MTDTSALFKRGEEAFQKRNYDYARDLFLNIVTIEPDNEKARKSLFATCMQKNKESGGAGRIRMALMQGKVSMELAAAKNKKDTARMKAKLAKASPLVKKGKKK